MEIHFKIVINPEPGHPCSKVKSVFARKKDENSGPINHRVVHRPPGGPTSTTGASGGVGAAAQVGQSTITFRNRD